MIPIPPLDGSHILFAILPGNNYQLQAQLSQYGFLILLGLIWFAPQIIQAPTQMIIGVMYNIAGIL